MAGRRRDRCIGAYSPRMDSHLCFLESRVAGIFSEQVQRKIPTVECWVAVSSWMGRLVTMCGKLTRKCTMW
uniref:Long chain acyl-CoA synthetase 4-like isoform X2 n=1 Tax=Rhizophora mucronata TaxID=61149 RepID=A0A2P2QXS0_RHIMU